MTYVFVGIGFLAFMSASVIAIDLGMLMTARNQAQNAADAGALAGATALLRDDWDDRTPSGPAVTSAIAAAKGNKVMNRQAVDPQSPEDGTVSVLPEDVTFPLDENGEATRVKVAVHRTAARGNPVSTMIANLLGIKNVDIAAVATAEVSPANAMTCVKPFTIPDKWKEMNNAPWDEGDTYETMFNKQNPMANCTVPGSGCKDIYIPARKDGVDQPDYTGYNQESERGTKLVLRAQTGDNINVSFYYSLALGKPVITGGDPYRWNIANCNTTIYHWGDPLTQEPGAMQGPTIQGAEELKARDPGAYWDAGTKSVQGSAFGSRSPRVFPIPLYDPEVYADGKRNGRGADLVTANWIGFFIEDVYNNGVWGRVIPIAGIRDRSAGPAPKAVNSMTIRLVE